MNREDYKVDLRVGDEVRVISGVRINEAGVIKGVSSPHGVYIDVLLNSDRFSSETICKLNRDLELIPTEKDIVVGSVWKGGKLSEPETITVIELNANQFNKVEFNDGKNCRCKFLLKHYKLIHRGEEESKEEWQSLIVKHSGTGVGGVYVNGKEYLPNATETPKKQKEKKMKTANKEIKEGMLVMDRDCQNTGKVDRIYPLQGKVTYIDQNDDSVHTVDIDRLFIPLVMPKPKPDKKKKGKKK